MEFKLEEYKTIEEVIERIQCCEGKHKQQIAYSSYHNSLTQVCFDCKKVRTNLIFISEDDSPQPQSTKQDKNEDLPGDTRKGCGELIVLEENDGISENGVCGVHGDYCDKCKGKVHQ